LKIYIYDYKTSIATEKRDFNDYIYNGILATEVNDFIQSKDIYKCDDLRVHDVLGMRFGVLEINLILADNQHYLFMYSTVISTYNREECCIEYGKRYWKHYFTNFLIEESLERKIKLYYNI
jgi:hypothetical protein